MPSFTSAHFINRELSWLEFNHRVLEEALDSSNPLLERVKFFCIVSSNLDEFFEVRVAGIKQQIESDVVARSVDGLTASETFRALHRRVRRMVDDQYACWRDELVPKLAEAGIRLLKIAELDDADREWVDGYYRTEVRPVLTPLGIDQAHPFPQLLNKSLNIIVRLEVQEGKQIRQRTAVVQIPRMSPRLVRLPRADSRMDFVFLGDLIGHYLSSLFTGATVLGFWRFRVTRNSELYIEEEDAVSLLDVVENELQNRRKGDAVRLEVEKDCPADLRAKLLEKFHLTADDLYAIDGPLNPVRLMTLYEGDHSPELRDPPFVAPAAKAFRGRENVFEVIRKRDVLLHHPYESFSSVVQFLEQAAEDPNVLAIKQTLYRSGGDPRIVGALMKAVQNGKQVTAVVELRARFDEANNILWSRRLEEAGVHVVYGLVGYKIHGKLCLVVRRDEDGLRRYLHLSTGNYNPTTARLYTDIGFFTARPDLAEDATDLFNMLTGICQFRGARKLLMAPFDLQRRMLELIEREAKHAREGLPSRIIAKMNSLVDKDVIEALYLASQAGVRIDLIVRGTCCLRPRVAGVSENIRVYSIVDRFLEHPRLFYFENACQPEVFLGSADWMPRNFHRRIEVVWPIEDGNLHERIVSEILGVSLRDNRKARELNAKGEYRRKAIEEGESEHRSQSEFIDSAKRSAGKRSARKDGDEKIKMVLAPRPVESGQAVKQR